jgi:chemotaxis protein methyltransferase CheR
MSAAAPLSLVDRFLDRVEMLTGLDLDRGSGRDVIARYLAKRAPGRAGEALLARLTSTTTPEAIALLDAVTVCHTSFYRDAEQMHLVERLLARTPPTVTARIWIAACATGEEAYTVALIAHRLGRDVDILATDLNASALAVARRGRYSAWALRALPATYRDDLVGAGSFELRPEVARSVRFVRHNLVDPPPEAAFDLVLCRNVLMYLSRPRIRGVLARLSGALAPTGKLLLGAGDVVAHAPEGLRIVVEGHRFLLERDETPARRDGKAPGHDAGVFGALAISRTSPALEVPPRLETAISAGPPPLVEPPEPIVIAHTPRGAILRGHALLDAGEVAGALRWYERALEVDPLDVEARFAAGLAHHLRGDPLAAIEALRGALVLDPDLWPAELYLGLSLRRLGERGAKEALIRAAQTAKRSPPLALSGHLASRLEAWRSDVAVLARMQTFA